MAGDRRDALLTASAALVAAAVASAAVVVPLRAHAILPDPGDLAVGWSMLLGALLAVRRTPVAGCLGLAGALWIAVGLAPLLPGHVEAPLTRLALLPAALLACASALLTARPHRWPVVVAGALALGAVALGGAGAGPAGLVGTGVAALIVPATAAERSSATPAVQLGVGLGLAAAGLDAGGVLGLPADLARTIGLLVLAVGGLAIGWQTRSSTSLEGRGLVFAGPTEPAPMLGLVLGRALGTGPVEVAFPGGSGGWLDPIGRPCSPAPSAEDATDADGTVIARTSPALAVEAALMADLHRFLRAAGEGARLRAALRERAVELDRSRERLVTASDEERLRLVLRLESGPLRRLEAIADSLRSTPDGHAWTVRLTAARRTLDELVAGLDPVESAGGLGRAVARLAEAAGVVARVDRRLPETIDPLAARAVWFACAEALANARKHAPGARTTLTLDAGDDLVATVTDDGPGGADPLGAGLAGLAGRLGAVGGDLDVTASGPGTTVTIRVPLRSDTGNDVVPLMSTALGPATVEP